MTETVSKVESVLDDLVTTLQGITQADGYWNTVGLVDRAVDEADVPEQIPADKFPACYVVERRSAPGGEVSRGMSGPATLRRTLYAAVVGWCRKEIGADERQSTALQKLTADITKILMLDRERGGHARMTEIGEVRWEYGLAADPFHRVVVELIMDYSHSKGGA
jgi:hypothetical protein